MDDDKRRAIVNDIYPVESTASVGAKDVSFLQDDMCDLVLVKKVVKERIENYI